MITWQQRYKVRLYAVMLSLTALFLLPHSQAFAACSSPSGNAGTIVYNGSEQVFQYCDDTNWIAMGLAGSGSGGCSSPTADEGTLFYNSATRALQGCTGSSYSALSPVDGTGKYLDVVLGYRSYVCALSEDREISCLGYQSSGVLGNGQTSWGIISAMTPILEPGPWESLTGGQEFVCGLKSDNDIYCWGSGSYNGTGSGTTGTPTLIAESGPWQMLSSHALHSCAIKTDGTAWCWGYNNDGQFGNGSIASSNVPVQVGTAATSTVFSDWIYISTGQSNSCGIRSNGTAWCWGSQYAGALGDGIDGAYASEITHPVQVGSGPGGTIYTDWEKIFAPMSYGACGLRSGGDLWCWGYNRYGHFGISGAAGNDILIPTQISGSGPWKDVTYGDGLFFLAEDDTAWFAGREVYKVGTISGLLLDVEYDVQTPIFTDMRWKKITAAYRVNDAACGVTTDGALYCWGDNDSGKLGISENAYSSCTGIPVQSAATATNDWIDVAAIGDDSYDDAGCALKNDNSIWCWGGNVYGFLGYNPGTIESFDLVPIAESGPWRSLEGSEDNHVCAVKQDNTAWCWGRDTDGQIGDGATSGDHYIPAQVDGGAVWQSISPGFNSTCGIRTDGTAWCWGEEVTGGLGNGAATTGNQISPTQVTGGGTWIQIAPGDGMGCGVKSDNSGWCWGDDSFGELGNGAAVTAQQDDPYPVAGGHSWREIQAGMNHACGIRTDGVMMCWGSDSSGTLGNGSGVTSDQDEPYLVAGGHTWKEFAMGAGSGDGICAVTTEERIYCWGDGDSWGTLGDCEYVDYDEPREVPIQPKGVTKVDMAEQFTAYIANGELHMFGWPYNYTKGTGQFDTIYIEAPKATNCANPLAEAGALYYNSTTNTLNFCDGGGWAALGK